MSTKSKRRAVRRAHLTEGREPQPQVTQGTAKEQVEGQLVGVLLNAITFGAVEPPQSKRMSEAS
ncbi:MAG: hypothetical protein JWP97_4545 [Labilithrix sp.]|nr:hypothetical protein [Labilithrix sp.]